MSEYLSECLLLPTQPTRDLLGEKNPSEGLFFIKKKSSGRKEFFRRSSIEICFLFFERSSMSRYFSRGIPCLENLQADFQVKKSINLQNAIELQKTIKHQVFYVGMSLRISSKLIAPLGCLLSIEICQNLSFL